MTSSYTDIAGTEHPVLAAQRRIAASFATNAPVIPGLPESGLTAIIAPVLETLGWRGLPRQIAEAMPHEVAVDDVEMLRAVLCRLGVDTAYSPISPREIRSRHCPCLIVRHTGAVHFVANAYKDGSVRIFDPIKGEWRRVKIKDNRGTVRLITLADLSRRQEATQRDGLVWPVLRSFGNEMRIVFWQSCFISLLGIAVSLYVMYVYDKAIGTSSLDTLAMQSVFATRLQARIDEAKSLQAKVDQRHRKSPRRARKSKATNASLRSSRNTWIRVNHCSRRVWLHASTSWQARLRWSRPRHSRSPPKAGCPR